MAEQTPKDMTAERVLTGGCACGQLTFRARGEPKRIGLCHCMTCRKLSGAPFNAFVIYPAGQVTLDGAFERWSATPDSRRCFCPACGSQVFERDQADEIEIKLGAFDEPDLFRPTYEAWTKRRESWLVTSELVGYEENRQA
jgi:hypothetical protein